MYWKAFLPGLLVIGLTEFAWADQVCLRRSTNTLLEYQSHATTGTCTQNAIVVGVDPADVEEREITRTEWLALWGRPNY